MLFALIVYAFGSLMNQPSPIEGDPANTARSPVSTRTLESANDTLSPGVTGVLPVVRLTPRDVHIADLDDSKIDLTGTWRFTHTVAESFDGTADSISNWAEVPVPAHPMLHGQPRMHREFGVRVAYTKSVVVPESWRNRRIILRFEGVDGLTKLYINGQPAGQTDIACLPSEYDITDFVRPGQSNEVTLTIERSLVTHWSRRELGGITRAVYLQALPTINLARLHVDTAVNNAGEFATINAHVRVANQSDSSTNRLRVRFELLDPNGRSHAIALKDASSPVQPVAAGQMLEFTVPLPTKNVLPWTAESPNLYTLVAKLFDGDTELMSAQQRFGFREIQVRGHDLLLNDTKLHWRGANYHMTYPGFGESMPANLIRKDVELLRAANFNVLRSRPTPDYGYVEACDELGMYTTVEAMISLMMYDKGPKGDFGADPAIAAPLRFHVATMIESMYSNPSIITWGLGNECFYYDYFKLAALGARAADRSRPTFFGSDMRHGVDAPFLDINDDHYPRDGTTSIDTPGDIAGRGWVYPDDRPNIFTEWLHVHVNNQKEVAFDPGIDDFWGYVAEAHIEHQYKMPHFLGGFLFKAAPYRATAADAHWRGIFEDDRRLNDMFWHTQTSHAPVQVMAKAARWAANRVEFDVINRFDFTPLREVRFEWTQGEQSGELKIDGEPNAQATVAFNAVDSKTPIALIARDANGRLINRWTLTPPIESGSTRRPTHNIRRLDREASTALVVGDSTFVIDTTTGLLKSAAIAGRNVIVDSPSLLVLPAQFRQFKPQEKLTLVNQAVDFKAERFEFRVGSDHVRIETIGAYTNARGRFVTTISNDAAVRIDYDFEWTGEIPFNVFSAGMAIPVNEACSTLAWQRDALWTWYPPDHIGRASGEAGATQTVGVDTKAWSQQLIDGVTRDFRSTKFNIARASLHDSEGVGVEVTAGEKRQHVQAVPLNGDLDGTIFTAELHGPRRRGFMLHVLDFHNGGTEPHLTKSLRFETKSAEPGVRFAGSMQMRLVAQ